MLKIVCVCHNGMGTSMLLKINVSSICSSNGINGDVEACSAGESLSFLANADIVITTPELLSIINAPDNIKVLSTEYIMDREKVEKMLVDCVKEYFPEELK